MNKRPVDKKAWRYKRDLINKLRYGLRAPLSCQLLYCRPGDITTHTTFVSDILPDHCATVPGEFAVQSNVLRKKMNDVIAGGDWDLNRMPIMDALPYKLTLEKLDSGKSWEEIGEYDRLREIIRIMGSCDHCKTQDDIDARYANMDIMIEEIRTQGKLKTRQDFGRVLFRELGGINIAIGRDGTFIKLQGGTHRLAIAVHFDLPVLPVCLRLVHKDYVRSGGFKTLLRKSAQLTPL